jgi:aspartyl-tRNA(Asn)/glutamyl-tRNA(Gln) amidotransferase subunit C
VGIETPAVRHIADLASLELSEEEVQLFSLQLNDILGYIEKLNELDLQAIEPTSHVTAASHADREDRVVPSLPVSEALANAPEPREGYFAVPKVIG